MTRQKFHYYVIMGALRENSNIGSARFEIPQIICKEL